MRDIFFSQFLQIVSLISGGLSLRFGVVLCCLYILSPTFAWLVGVFFCLSFPCFAVWKRGIEGGRCEELGNQLLEVLFLVLFFSFFCCSVCSIGGLVGAASAFDLRSGAASAWLVGAALLRGALPLLLRTRSLFVLFLLSVFVSSFVDSKRGGEVALGSFCFFPLCCHL